MKTENAIIITLIMIIIVATGIFTHLETLTYIPTLEVIIPEISYDSSNSIDFGGSIKLKRTIPKQLVKVKIVEKVFERITNDESIKF